MSERTLPLARSKGLIVQEVQGETLVYDLERDRAYCLNPSAALVWRHCDGETGVDEVVAALRQELKTPASEEVVWLALRRLERSHLVEARVAGPLAARYTRRQVLQTLAAAGIAAAVLPTIVSVVAPTAAQAATCVTDCSGLPYGTPCNPTICNKICCGPSGPFPYACKKAVDCI